MKTLSVKQVAECLGLSTRAVLKRLNNEQLKGVRRPNKYGVEEWWIYPNKEIRAALESSGKSDILVGEDISSGSDVDIVDVYTGDFSPDDATATDNPNPTADNVKSAANGVAEELWNNIISKFVGQLQERDQLIGEMRSEIAEKDRQLKLLPDLQKRAEKEHQEAELKALESEALKKQISALQVQIDERLSPEVEKQLKEEKASKEAELATLQVDMQKEREQREAELTALRAQLAAVDEYKKLADEAKARLDEMKKLIEEKTLQDDAEKAAALAEVKRLKEEKALETASIQEQLASLTRKLERTENKSWWKKFFGLGGKES